MKTVTSSFRRSWTRLYRVWRPGHYRILAGQLRDLAGRYVTAFSAVAALAIVGIVISFFLIRAPSQASREPSS